LLFYLNRRKKGFLFKYFEVEKWMGGLEEGWRRVGGGLEK